MTKKSEIDRILALLPVNPVDPEPTSVQLARARARFGRFSGSELTEMRQTLESIAVEYADRPNEKWEAAQERVHDMSNLQPLLDQWEILNDRAKELLREYRT